MKLQMGNGTKAAAAECDVEHMWRQSWLWSWEGTLGLYGVGSA